MSSCRRKSDVLSKLPRYGSPRRVLASTACLCFVTSAAERDPRKTQSPWHFQNHALLAREKRAKVARDDCNYL